MTIFEKARELGEMISETTQGKRLADAKYIFDGNTEAQQLFFRYQNEREAYKIKMQNGTATEEEQENFSKLTEEIQNNEVVVELLLAQNEFSDFTQMVFDVISATAEGEMPVESAVGCSGSCSSCSGCH